MQSYVYRLSKPSISSAVSSATSRLWNKCGIGFHCCRDSHPDGGESLSVCNGCTGEEAAFKINRRRLAIVEDRLIMRKVVDEGDGEERRMLELGRLLEMHKVGI